MPSKWKINLIAFLISLTLFSVGFSSWQITNNSSLTENGSITVDSVGDSYSDSGDLVQFLKFDFFTYDDEGFISSTGESTTKATVSAHFQLLINETAYQSNLVNYFSNSNSLHLVATLKPYSNHSTKVLNTTLFSNCTFEQAAFYQTLNGNAAQLPTPTNEGITISSFSVENGVYEIGINLNNILDSDFTLNSKLVYYVSVRVDFTFDVGDNYTAFYNAINDSAFGFGVSAIVSGLTTETVS